MPAKKKAASKRELIEPTKGDKRYVRRKADGTFGKTVDDAPFPDGARHGRGELKFYFFFVSPRSPWPFGTVFLALVF